VVPEIQAVYARMQPVWPHIRLYGVSIGAWLAMQALRAEKLEKALLVSPVVDMETLILSMMQGAHVTEEQLKAAGEIPTEMGETLSWTYLCWVREHPLQWHTPTQVLYGDKDALTSRAVMERFRRQSGAHLTILQGGEHWFHTPVQLAALESWEAWNL
jgi:surfactin synthase thioesterase subunit